jgi:beta-1,4-N-acetylglucosaminyltransferase
MGKIGNVFVTVGTTEFPQLIRVVSGQDFAEVVHKLGCKQLTVQHGRGPEPNFDGDVFRNIATEHFDLKATITNEIATADLVISHAGAGSCIDVLSARKPLIVVVNEDLMHNHQTELAEQLHKEGFLHYCTPRTLVQTLREVDLSQLRPYTEGNVKEFVAYLDKFMGF